MTTIPTKRTYTALPLEGLTHKEQAQAIFDHVITHLKVQGHPAHEEDGSCAYRAEDGSACAVGCLIPDEDYNPVFECKSLDELTANIRKWCEESQRDEVVAQPGLLLARLHLLHHADMLGDLQIVHDNWNIGAPFYEVAPKFEVVALRYRLNSDSLSKDIPA